jgi:hypothetical protein
MQATQAVAPQVEIQVYPTKLEESKNCFDFQQELHNPVSTAADKSVTDFELGEALVKSDLCYSLHLVRGGRGYKVVEENTSTDTFDPKVRLKALLDDVVQPWEKTFSGKSYEIRIWHDDPKQGLYYTSYHDPTAV